MIAAWRSTRWLACALVLGCAPKPIDVVDAAAARTAHGELDQTQRIDWNGFYNSPQSGVLEIRQHGDQVIGRYDLVAADGVHVQGRLRGSVRGNLAKVSWQERRETPTPGVPRENVVTNSSSDGYFYYVPDPLGSPAWRLVGQQYYYVGDGLSKEYRHDNIWTATCVEVLPTAQPLFVDF